MVQARRAPGCRDFVVAADPLEPGRVNVHEEWDSEAELEAFRGDGPEADLAADIVHADVTRHHVVFLRARLIRPWRAGRRDP